MGMTQEDELITKCFGEGFGILRFFNYVLKNIISPIIGT